jgi:glutamate-5-semialdehyde dehydrogenase
MEYVMKKFLTKAKESKQIIATLDSRTKSRVLNEMAEAIFENAQYIIEENKKDMVFGEKNRLISYLLDRLLLNKSRITSMAK